MKHLYQLVAITLMGAAYMISEYISYHISIYLLTTSYFYIIKLSIYVIIASIASWMLGTVGNVWNKEYKEIEDE